MRYLPLTQEDRAQMRAAIGVADVAALYADVPEALRLDAPLDLPRGKSEMAVERLLGAMAKRNLSAARAPFFIGAGAYRHHIPASVDHLVQRSEFLTSYTPYQPEISQGTLQYLFEFQTQVATLTGMEIANASMYDGSTACAEAALMAHRITKRPQGRAARGGLHPHYAEGAAHASRICRRRDRLPRARTFSRARTWPRRSMKASPASSCRRRTSSVICAISRRSRGLPSSWRVARSPSSPRSSLSAC